MKRKSEITPRQEKLIAHLLTERTIELACTKSGVAVVTCWRWMKTPTFLNEYRRVRRSILENAVAKLQSLSQAAIDTLERNLSCENPASEIRSAAIILEQTLKGIDLLDLAPRIEMLETLIEHRKTNE